MKRRLVQFLSALLANAHLSGFATLGLYQGDLKRVCVPILNCYSCPGAVVSCPLGSLQSLLASAPHRLSLYVLGLMTFTGAAAGRFACGWLCPFGFFQDYLARLRPVKYQLPRWLTRSKYLLLVLTLVLPVLLVGAQGIGEPYFCKFLCPAGTLEAGLTLGLLRPELRSLLGLLFLWKVAVLALFLVAMVFIYRPFCRVACPLGAFYGLFNCFSLWRLEVAPGCDHCGWCRRSCPLGIPVDKSPNNAECIRCLACLDSCPHGLLSFGIKASRSSDYIVQNGHERGIYHE